MSLDRLNLLNFGCHLLPLLLQGMKRAKLNHCEIDSAVLTIEMRKKFARIYGSKIECFGQNMKINTPKINRLLW